MWARRLEQLKERMHARLCFQLFSTPLPTALEEAYRHYDEHGKDFLAQHRSARLIFKTPRRHVIHHFAAQQYPAQRILIAHGWMSCAAHMVRFIRCLQQAGYEVFALDFPAHGEAGGLRLPWTDAVLIMRQLMEELGPLHAVIGHSFGGSMLLNTLILAARGEPWTLHAPPKKAILLASPIRMRVPVSRIARKMGLNGASLRHLKELFHQHSAIDIRLLDYRQLAKKPVTEIMCLHGQDDCTIPPSESIVFCQHYPQATLVLMPNADHADILIDPRSEQRILEFL